MDAFKVAVVGLGGQGKEHLQACREHKDVQLRAVCDSDPDRMRVVEFPPDVVKCENPEHLPRDLDGVIVASPPCTYQEIVPRLLDRGFHVLLEKPPGKSTAEAISFVEKARKVGRIVLPCAQRQFHPSYRELAEFIARESSCQAICCEIVMEIEHKAGGWRASSVTGTLLDLGYHAVDLARMLFGDLTLVTATLLGEDGKPSSGKGDGDASLLLYTESGTWVRINTARASEAKTESVRLEYPDHVRLVDRTAHRIETQDGVGPCLFECEKGWDIAMRDQLSHWIGICRHEDKSVAEDYGWGALITMRIIEEAYHVHIL